MADRAEPLVVGVGNRMRRDDGAGLCVAERLATGGAPCEIRLCDGDLSQLVDWAAGRERVFVIDAVVSPQLAPGQWRRLSALGASLPSSPPRSTHALGLGQAVGLLRALGGLPGELWLYAIGVGELGHGEGLSPPVAAAVAAASQALSDELSTVAGPATTGHPAREREDSHA